MRRGLTALLLGSVAIIAMMHAASAADLGARPVTKAPPPMAPPFSWTGFYLGGHVGAGFVNNDFSRDGFHDFPDGQGGFIRRDFHHNHSNDDVGFIGGGQVGWNYQFGNIVIGIEGDISATTIDKDVTDCFGVAGAVCNARLDWTALATGRLGYAFDRHLLYVKGGGAWAKFRFDDNGPISNFHDGDTRSGWTIGGGWEYAFLPNWSTKIEYNFLDFGNHDRNHNGTGFAFNDRFRNEIHQVKVGLNWRFGGYGYGGGSYPSP
jgi:outer membrane immunogenic protein